MRLFLTVYWMLAMVNAMAHHNPDHIEVSIDPTLLPPQQTGYLWFVLGPLAVAIVIGLLKAISRHRKGL